MEETRTLVEAPPTGIHRHVTDEEYHTWHGLSASRLKMISDGMTPARLWHEMHQPDKDTPARVLGKAIHCLVLQRDVFPERFIQGLDRDRRSNANKQAWAEFENEHHDKTILKVDDWKKVHRTAESILKSPALRTLLKCEGHSEIAITWKTDNGVACKALVDHWIPELNTFLDLKSTEAKDRRKIERDIVNFKYYLQGPWYMRGARANNMNVGTFTFGFAEKDAPFCDVVYLSEEYMQIGDAELEEPISILSHCYAHNDWPGHDEVDEIAPPAWKTRQFDTC